MLGQYRLRVKLHALYFHCFVTQPHHKPVGRLGGYLKRIRHAVALDDQRMIPSGREIIWDARENSFAVVDDLYRLSMYRFGGPRDFTAKMLADRLMAETDAEDRQFVRKPFNELQAKCPPRPAFPAPARSECVLV